MYVFQYVMTINYSAKFFHFSPQSFHFNAQSFHLKLRKLLILSHFSPPKHMKLLNVLKQHR